MSAAPAAGVAGRIAGTVRADIRALAAYPVAHAEGCIKLDAMECPYELPEAVRDDIARAVMVSETSWHDGHPVHHRRYPGLNKGSWLRHVLDETDIARQHGAIIAGVCWYPIVDCPPWHAPRSRNRWSHGLIRADLSLDEALSAELTAMAGHSMFRGRNHEFSVAVVAA